MTSERTARHIVVHGLVQGVFFRESMKREAQARGVSGWVRNRGDGTVEAILSGDAEAVDALLAWARTGPPAARVERIEVEPAVGTFEGFEKRPTVP